MMERKYLRSPAPDDLAGWKEAGSRLTRRFVSQMDESWFWSARALKGYFGDEDARSLLIANEARAVVQAYTTWAILDYRPARTAKSHAEKMLAEGLPEPEATLLRARIEFVGDELVLTVNSAKRLTTARGWLEKLPGVAFRNVTTRRLDEPAKDRPLDERISKPQPVEMTPELTASVQEMMNKHYMAWLDMPLPVLGGKTPRQACRTPDGRRQVTMLIRTTPDPMGPAPVRVPRQAMLQELGLDAEPPPEPVAGPLKLPSHEPTPIAPPYGKIGRNDPCPCGSGKKYKKCCGR
jgi:hypothetical protein